MNDTTKPAKWFELLELVKLCPGEVPEVNPTVPTKTQTPESDIATKTRKRRVESGMVQIKGGTRILLFAFAHHADGNTNETWTSRRTLLAETATSINTLDGAIADLKRAGLLRIRKEFNQSKGTFRHIWILQRDRLALLAGEQIDVKVIEATVTAAINDGLSSIECSHARVEQTRSALYAAAGSTTIHISDEVLTTTTKLVVSTGDAEQKTIAADDNREPSPPEPIPSYTLSKNRRFEITNALDLREPASLTPGEGTATVQHRELESVRAFIAEEYPGAVIEEGTPDASEQVRIVVRWKP